MAEFSRAVVQNASVSTTICRSYFGDVLMYGG